LGLSPVRIFLMEEQPLSKLLVISEDMKSPPRGVKRPSEYLYKIILGERRDSFHCRCALVK
jgi:hypothetical protein